MLRLLGRVAPLLRLRLGLLWLEWLLLLPLLLLLLGEVELLLSELRAAPCVAPLVSRSRLRHLLLKRRGRELSR